MGVDVDEAGGHHQAGGVNHLGGLTVDRRGHLDHQPVPHGDVGDVPGAAWTVPAGGLYVWLVLDGIDTGPNGPLIAAALDEGVLYVPGEFGHVPDESGRVPTNECRICFGVATTDQIAEGIRRLRRAVGVIQGLGKPEKMAARV